MIAGVDLSFGTTRCAGIAPSLGVAAWLGCLILCCSSVAEADEGRFTVHLSGVARGYTLGATDGRGVPVRRYTQHVGLSGFVEPRDGTVLSFSTRLRLDTDQGLDGTTLRRLDDTSIQFVEPSLEEAWVSATGLGLLDVTLGRHLVLSPVGFVDIDGVTLVARARTGASIKIWSGLEVRKQQFLLDDDAFDSGRADRNGRSAQRGYVAGGALGYDMPELSFRLGYQERGLVADRSGDGIPRPVDTSRELRRQQLGASVSATPAEPVDLVLSAVYGLDYRELDSAVADASVQIWKRTGWRIGLAAESWVPRFDTDTIWAVFGARPYGGYRAYTAADLDFGHSTLRPDAAAWWRGYGDPDAQGLVLPGTAAAAREAAGGEVGARWRTDRVPRTYFTAWGLHARATFENGYGEVLARALAGGELEVVRKRAYLDLTLHAGRIERDLQPLLAGNFGAARLGGRFFLEDVGQISGFVEEASHPLLYHELRIMAAWSMDMGVLE